MTGWAGSEIRLTQSQLAVLAKNVTQTADDEKREFARIALSQMYATYQAKLVESYNESIRQPKNKGLARWRHATRDYLNDIQQALSQIQQGSYYDFFVNPQGRIVFSVTEKLLMITGPNSKSERSLESNIVKQFCDQYDCQAYFTKPEQEKEQPVKDTRPIVKGRWLISKQYKADYYTDIGIIFRFSNLKNRAQKADWALQVSRDLALIIHTLNSIQTQGYRADLASLSISNDSGERGVVQVIINKKGDFIQLPLPMLSKSTAIHQKIAPWIQQLRLNTADQDAAIVVLSEQYYSKS
jgi:hypothetical protein